jgi:hypothetical protein
MKKLLILLVILILGSCKPRWNDENYPIVITGVSIFDCLSADTLYKYEAARRKTYYYFKSYDFYNINDTVEIKVK